MLRTVVGEMVTIESDRFTTEYIIALRDITLPPGALRDSIIPPIVLAMPGQRLPALIVFRRQGVRLHMLHWI